MKPPISEETLAPHALQSLEDTGLSFNFLADLTLKTAYFESNCTTERIAERLRLPVALAQTLLQHLYREKLLEIREGRQAQLHRYGMLDRGWERAQRLLQISGYVGPTPVSLESYTQMVQWQEQHRERADPATVAAVFDPLVLSQSTLQTLGLVVSSRRSLFMTGPPGSGKTTIARLMQNAQLGDIWIPHAIEVDGQVIKVFDTHNHVPVEVPASIRYDRRWIKIQRPMSIVGGELTIENMDLTHNEAIGYYEAPFQLKSNGGILVIDDFGRQRVDPNDLLNRWIIPLENRLDYLTLHTGKKIEVPFEQLLVFATNLNAKDIVDEAFLRRMGYRLTISAPSADTYRAIFRRYAEARGLDCDSTLLETVLSRYEREDREMKSCEPRDLIERCLDICKYESRPPALSPGLLNLAWANYFGAAQ